MKQKERLLEFIKKEAVLTSAFFLALISCLFNPPGMEYLGFIDFRILGILFGLMLVLASLRNIGIFSRICHMLLKKIKSTRQLTIMLVLLCFFSSMFITNDAALVTFVPLAVLTLVHAGCEESIVLVVILQTLAANLGSMLMPSGNPQNLYLYNISGMSMGDFILLMLPYSALSLVMLFVVIFTVKSKEIQTKDEGSDHFGKRQTIQAVICALLFVIGILTVCRMIPWEAFALLSAGVMIFLDRRAFGGVDYSLLFIFVFFFIFIGNISSIPQIRSMLGSIVSGNETLIGVGASQVISNVPAALMLSGFTENYKELIIGTDLGGLGTLIASMASLISYKAVAARYPEKRGHYILSFTVLNIIFLAALIGEYFVLLAFG